MLLAGNSDVRVSYAATDAPSGLYRDSMGDECVYIEAGEGTVQTTFGALAKR